MPTEQQKPELPNQARENSKSNPSQMDVSRQQDIRDDDTPKCPSTYQDWASF